MPKIVTTSPFTLTLDDGRTFTVPAGESEQPDEVAAHPFTVAHLVSTPKGRMPLVEGEGGLMIEADEAGQRVVASALPGDPLQPPVRQEGPVEWSNGNTAAEADAARAAEAAGLAAESTPAVDGKEAARVSADRRRAAAAPVPASVPAPAPVKPTPTA